MTYSPSQETVFPVADDLDPWPCGLLELDEQGVIVAANRWFESRLAQPSEGLIGQHISILLLPVGRIYVETHVFPLLRLQQFVEEIALDLRIQDGGRLPSLLNGRLTLPGPGRPAQIHLAVMEAHERRRYERELLSTKRMLEARNHEIAHANAQLSQQRDNLQQLVEARTETIQKQADDLAQALDAQRALNEQQIQFVRTASHEFRTPISVIAMAVRRARKAMAAHDSVDHGKRLDVIESQLTRLGLLIDSTLNLAKSDAGKLEFSPRSVSVADYLEKAIGQHADAVESHRIDCRIEGLEGIIVEADVALLDHVLDNLISNAKKYSPGSEAIEVRACLDDGAVRVDVRDFGIGIPQDEIAKIFQRYFRASTSSGIAGTGIGLSVVKEFVALHGGTVAVKSEVCGGTTFTIRLPAAVSDEQRGAA